MADGRTPCWKISFLGHNSTARFAWNFVWGYKIRPDYWEKKQKF